MAATHTTNLNLNKPDRQDFVSVVSDINDNMDIIDGALGYTIITDFNTFKPDSASVSRKYGYCTGGTATNAPVSGDNITYRGYVEGVPTYFTQHFTIEYAGTSTNRTRSFIRVCLGGTFLAWRELSIADYYPGDKFIFNGNNTPCRTLNDLSGLYFVYRLPKNINNAITGFTVTVTSNSNVWGISGASVVASGATAGNKQVAGNAICFSLPVSGISASGAGVCSLNATITFT